MLRFPSIASRIVLLHVVAVMLTAVVMPLVLFWLLNSEISNLHRAAMRDQAQAIARKIKPGADGKLTLDLPQGLRDLYSEAYGRYFYDVIDPASGVLFSSRHDGALLFPVPPASERFNYQETQRNGRMVSGASVLRDVGGRKVWIQVAEDLSHRDVITDDIVANFFRHVGWITLPILLLLLAIDIVIFRRAMRPLLQASEEARRIGPARTDVRLPLERIPTEIQPLVAAVNQALERLAAGFRAQREFTADAAHELRTPLAILRTRIDTLPDRSVVADLNRDIDGMGRIVGQLLDIAELNTLVVDPAETADLPTVCADVVEFVAPLAVARHKSIALRSAAQALAVRGNAEMLRRAIRNLVENAVHHTPAGTTVEVVVEADGTVSVLDEGPGIPAEQRDLIFERFWRSDRRRPGGAGLGLSIVRRTVEQYGGSVTVTNRATGGAQFTLALRPVKAGA